MAAWLSRPGSPGALRVVPPLLSLVLLGSGCGSEAPRADRPAVARTSTSVPAGEQAAETPAAIPSAAPIALRRGERRQVLRLAAPYRPAAPNGVGSDDYHCFLLDPKLARNTSVTGYDIRPGNLAVVHHVILFRVPPSQVATAKQKDAETPGDGWTCFGNSGIGDGLRLDDAPWLGAWAPGGGERIYGKGLGTPLARGSMIVAQIHYNLFAGDDPDQSSVVLRETRPGVRVRPLRTLLLPAPVELPCRPDHAASPLCDRAVALADVKRRFGTEAGATADLLHFLCGPIRPGPVQTCDQPMRRDVTVRAAAGHMHLLGTSIRIEANPGTPRARTLLDIPVWDFDNQGSRRVGPVRLDAFDKVRVTCHHAQFLRDQQPAFERQRADRYVVWGEGSTDEMCLGILLITDH